MTPILAFVTITYALSIALSLIVGLTGGYASPLIRLMYLTMFVPAAAVAAVRLAFNEGPRVRGRRVRIPYVFAALFLMPGVMHAVMLPVTAALEGGLHWQDRCTGAAGAVAARIALNAGAGLIVVSILALFEEVGWRAWLLPRLIERWGARRAIVATALVWAFWHAPFALSGIQHVDGLSAIRTAMIMPIGIMGAGLVIGWLWVRTESLWIVALAHGSLNNWGQYAFKCMNDSVAADPGLVLGAGCLAVLAVGSLLVARGLPSASLRP